MRTDTHEFFYSVKGLMIPKDNVSDKIIDYIELFVDQVPILTEQIRYSLNENKTVAVIASMKSIIFLLGEIHANWLKTEAERILRQAESDNLYRCVSDVELFVSELLSLSIELQIAQKNTDGLITQSKIEDYTNILNNINAIAELIDNREYDLAYTMIDYIEELKVNKNAQKLKDFLRRKEHKNAVLAAEALRSEFSGQLKLLGGILSDHKKVILAVDDHPAILKTVKGMLKGLFNIHAAAGGKTALAIMEVHKPDLFLLDIEMPDIGGFELAKTIRAMEAFASTPIIFLTSNATKEHVLEALACGANDFIVKPASYNSLIVKISKLI